MARPLIALLTDFGLRDHYVSAMKGVMLGICPEASLVDISHDVAPQDVLGAALELAAAYAYFPPGTIFLVVVDPGVGSTRRAIAVDAGGYRFVAPDNGVLSLVVERSPLAGAVELTASEYARSTISKTFEGRDRFAPAAAWLATGVPLTALGRPAPPLVRLEVPSPRATAAGIDGAVLRVDRFGNLITNIDQATLRKLSGVVTVQIGSYVIPRIVATYAEAKAGELCALVGSSDHLEIAVNGGSAAATVGQGRGAIVQLRASA
jgi:S-adenosyl-L-methionine hydrolase (adenosine-forming)